MSGGVEFSNMRRQAPKDPTMTLTGLDSQESILASDKNQRDDGQEASPSSFGVKGGIKRTDRVEIEYEAADREQRLDPNRHPSI